MKMEPNLDDNTGNWHSTYQQNNGKAVVEFYIHNVVPPPRLERGTSRSTI